MSDDVYTDDALKNEEQDVEGHVDEVTTDDPAQSEDKEPDVEGHVDDVLVDEVLTDDAL